jgi:glycosyltransferase involved in cell wall biosynthesis
VREPRTATLARVKILHVVPTYLPARRYGGPIYAVHGLAKALAARGHEVDVFTTNVDGPNDSNVPLGTSVDLDGVGVWYFPSSFRRLYWSGAMRSTLARSVADYDVVHIHSVFLYPTAAAAHAAQRARVPYVISPRGMLVPELIRQKSRWTKTAWIRLVERGNFAAASAIHFTSEREQDDARGVALPIPSPFVVPNGIELPEAVDVPRDENTIVFLGRISWKKGVDRLIAAMPLLRDTRLVIAGNDDEKLTPRLRELAEKLGVSNRVAFIGRVDGEAKFELLARATIFALASLSENFGNVVLEAMAMKTPVVVTPEVGLAEEVRRARAGVIAMPHELASALDSLLHDPARQRAMGERGRKAVENHFTWPNVAAAMEAHYARLLR